MRLTDVGGGSKLHAELPGANLSGAAGQRQWLHLRVPGQWRSNAAAVCAELRRITPDVSGTVSELHLHLPLGDDRGDQSRLRADLLGLGAIAAGRRWSKLHLLLPRPCINDRAALLPDELRRFDGDQRLIPDQRESDLLLSEREQFRHDAKLCADLRLAVGRNILSGGIHCAVPQRQRQHRHATVCPADLRVAAGHVVLPNESGGNVPDIEFALEPGLSADLWIPVGLDDMLCRVGGVLCARQCQCRHAYLPATDLRHAAGLLVLPKRAGRNLSEWNKRREQPRVCGDMRVAVGIHDLPGRTSGNVHGRQQLHDSADLCAADLRHALADLDV